MLTAGRFESFESFWPFYLAEHRKPLTRWLHFIGTASLLPLFIIALIDTFWWLLLYPVCAYGLAWFGHFFIEKNKPATFSFPLWSLFGDFKMFWYMLIGQLDEELRRHGIGNI